jgi:hypothetical protein
MTIQERETQTAANGPHHFIFRRVNDNTKEEFVVEMHEAGASTIHGGYRRIKKVKFTI